MQIDLGNDAVASENVSFSDERLALKAGADEGTLLCRVLSTADISGRIRWREHWTAPQRWRKHPDNPIYGPDQSGDWDDWTNGVSIVPHPDGERYRMFYCGREGSGIGVAEARIDAPRDWAELPGCPVFVPRRDNWEGNRINQPRVVIVSDDHWRMYFTGWGFEGPGTSWAMGVAESHDAGLTWERCGEGPMMERGGADSPDGGGACVPTVVRAGDRWMMWYTAGIINPNGHTQIHLCLAYSGDGLHWEKYEGNPVLGDDFSDDPPRSVTSRCTVRHDNDVFRMWYSYACPNYEIWYAESTDGIHWEKSPLNPVLAASRGPGWDDEIVEYPEVQIMDGVYRLWFCGNGYGSVGYAEGVTESGVELACRSGDSPEPDDRWSGWDLLSQGEALPTSPFCQLRVRLWSANAAVRPAISKLNLGR